MSPEAWVALATGIVLPPVGLAVKVWADARELRHRLDRVEREAEKREERLLDLLREVVEALRDGCKD